MMTTTTTTNKMYCIRFILLSLLHVMTTCHARLGLRMMTKKERQQRYSSSSYHRHHHGGGRGGGGGVRERILDLFADDTVGGGGARAFNNNNDIVVDDGIVNLEVFIYEHGTTNPKVPISNVKVTVAETSSTGDQTQRTTNGEGIAMFNNLISGEFYDIELEPKIESKLRCKGGENIQLGGNSGGTNKFEASCVPEPDCPDNDNAADVPVLVGLGSGGSAAQHVQTIGKISGIIQDVNNNGKGIDKANVELLMCGGGSFATLKTDKNGEFNPHDVPQGNVCYDIKVTHKDYTCDFDNQFCTGSNEGENCIEDISESIQFNLQCSHNKDIVDASSSAGTGGGDHTGGANNDRGVLAVTVKEDVDGKFDIQDPSNIPLSDSDVQVGVTPTDCNVASSASTANGRTTASVIGGKIPIAVNFDNKIKQFKKTVDIGCYIITAWSKTNFNTMICSDTVVNVNANNQQTNVELLCGTERKFQHVEVVTNSDSSQQQQQLNPSQIQINAYQQINDVQSELNNIEIRLKINDAIYKTLNNAPWIFDNVPKDDYNIEVVPAQDLGLICNPASVSITKDRGEVAIVDVICVPPTNDNDIIIHGTKVDNEDTGSITLQIFLDEDGKGLSDSDRKKVVTNDISTSLTTCDSGINQGNPKVENDKFIWTLVKPGCYQISVDSSPKGWDCITNIKVDVEAASATTLESTCTPVNEVDDNNNNKKQPPKSQIEGIVKFRQTETPVSGKVVLTGCNGNSIPSTDIKLNREGKFESKPDLPMGCYNLQVDPKDVGDGTVTCPGADNIEIDGKQVVSMTIECDVVPT